MLTIWVNNRVRCYSCRRHQNKTGQREQKCKRCRRKDANEANFVNVFILIFLIPFIWNVAKCYLKMYEHTRVSFQESFRRNVIVFVIQYVEQNHPSQYLLKLKEDAVIAGKILQNLRKMWNKSLYNGYFKVFRTK